ncbi:site-specific DNA-methyltransferase [Pseudomonadales bacterium]|nr:site-specific DNA-methyltransferase [Pseudomonadales bacterium]
MKNNNQGPTQASGDAQQSLFEISDLPEPSDDFVFEGFERGEIWCGDSQILMNDISDESLDLCFTSPPFPLITKKSYGNEDEKNYIDWLMPFLDIIARKLKPTGSLVIDLGCCWEKGLPVRSTYDLRLPLRIIDELGLYFAQEFYWYNPSRLPTPAEWVTIRKERVKDSVDKILWFSKTPHPKALNTRVLQPYSKSMEAKFGKNPDGRRPSGHKPSRQMHSFRNAGSIPGNLIACGNNNRSEPYLKFCRANDLTPHPARFPYEIAEFFIRFLTKPNDLILDPFAGSCTSGFAAEKNGRNWLCIEENADYVATSRGHFFTRPEREEAAIVLPRVGNYAEPSLTDDEGQPC